MGEERIEVLKKVAEAERSEIPADPTVDGEIGDEESEEPFAEEVSFALIYSFAYEGHGNYAIRIGRE